MFSLSMIWKMSTLRTAFYRVNLAHFTSNLNRTHKTSRVRDILQITKNRYLQNTKLRYTDPLQSQTKYCPQPFVASLCRFSTTRFQNMADDTSYNTFLTRANQDPSSGHSAEGHSTSQARSQFDPSSKSSSQGAVPASLRDLNITYTSDTDSEFEPVFFSYASDDLPDVEQFTKVLGVKGENAANVEELSVSDFDPRGQYAQVVEKVKAAGVEERGKRGAGAGEAAAKIFKVQLDGSGTRIEYYVVSVGERSLVGVVAKAVES